MSNSLHRALTMLPNNGMSQAKKIADLLVKTNVDNKGDTTIEGYNQAIGSLVNSGFGATVDGQRQIAAYQNRVKDLSAKQAASSETLSALKLKEHAAWYIDEDEADNTSFRNPAYVAQVTSESLDMLVAETVQNVGDQKAQGKDTSDLETYLGELVKRADRMRSVSDNLADGKKESLDGYGYYLDGDPNTGKVRGASFMPTDIGVNDIGQGAVRTDTYVSVGDKKVPLYVPYVKDASGTVISKFGGRDYSGTTSLVQGSDTSDAILTDKNSFPYDGDTFQRGQVYRSFNGKSNIDGSPKQDMYYVGFDNKLYKFGDDDPTGKKLIEDLKATGSLNTSSFPRLNPYTVSKFNASPLPTDPTFEKTQARGAQVESWKADSAQKQAESDALNNRSGLQKVGDEVGGFFSRMFGGNKNTPDQPEPIAATSGNDVIDSNNRFFVGH